MSNPIVKIGDIVLLTTHNGNILVAEVVEPIAHKSGDWWAAHLYTIPSGETGYDSQHRVGTRWWFPDSHSWTHEEVVPREKWEEFGEGS
jgi:hypothetical protein